MGIVAPEEVGFSVPVHPHWTAPNLAGFPRGNFPTVGGMRLDRHPLPQEWIMATGQVTL